MKRMAIYEPAMCCETGLCGVGIDPELMRISTVLNTLNKNGFSVDRYNLSSAPMAFVNNKVINDFLNQENGADQLPVVLLDDKIVLVGRYPSNEEFAAFLDIPAEYLTEAKQESASDCSYSDRGCC